MRDVPVLALPDIILATITQRVVVARRGAAGAAAGQIITFMTGVRRMV